MLTYDQTLCAVCFLALLFVTAIITTRPPTPFLVLWTFRALLVAFITGVAALGRWVFNMP